MIDLLSQDLFREYLAIIGYVVYPQVLKNAEFSHAAGELEKHVERELEHARIIGEQIDYLSCMLSDEARNLSSSKNAVEMLQANLDLAAEAVRNYRERASQCENLSEFAVSEQIREIEIDKQQHQIALEAAMKANAANRKLAARNGLAIGAVDKMRQNQGSSMLSLIK